MTNLNCNVTNGTCYLPARIIIRYLFFVLCIIFNWNDFILAEDVQLLKRKLVQSSAMGKSAIFNKLSKALWWDNDNREEALEYGFRALEYAKKFEQLDQQVYALANIGHAYRRIDDYEKALNYANQSLRLAEQRKSKVEILYALEVIGEIYGYIPENEKALEIFQRMVSICEEIGDKGGVARNTHVVGTFYYYLGEINTALKYFKEALELYKRVNNRAGIVQMLEYIGSLNVRLGRNDLALQYYIKAAKIAESNALDFVTGRVYVAMGKLYKKLKKYNSATEYFSKALKVFKRVKNYSWLSSTYNHLGDLFRIKRDYNRALAYLEKALKLNLKEDSSGGNQTSDILMAIGRVYFEKTDYEKALAYYFRSLKLGLEFKEIHTQAYCYRYIGEIKLIKDAFRNSLFYLQKSLEMSKLLNESSLEKDSYKLLSDLYARMGKFKEALKYHRLYSNLKDQMYSDTSAEKIAEMQARYEAEKKEREIEMLRKDKAIQGLRLSRERIVRYALIIVILLVLIIFGLLFRKFLYLFSFWKRERYIGQFRLLDKIGGGGMATVFKAHSIRDKSETVAVKVLREELFGDEISKKRFKQEAAIIDKLEHPHIIRIFERGEYREKLFIAMELLQGRNLETKIREEGRLDLRESFYIMNQICDALVLIHGKNIVHRDLKPANIMLVEKDGDPNFVKLLDFGLAKMKFQTQVTQTGIMVGTISYMSPEQILSSEFSPASDVYSLGVIFYEMLTGQKPFHGDTKTEIMKQILDSTPIEPGKFRPDIPDELNILIMQMLAKEKESRPDIQTVLARLKAIQSPPGQLIT